MLCYTVGVDVVLNSLSGDKLTASLACLACYGHFCEIGKYDIQQNSPVGLGLLERNVSLHCIDLSDMFDKPKVWLPVHALVAAGMLSGEIKPLRTTVFSDVEQGLRYIASGRHIGKVLVDLRAVCAADATTADATTADTAATADTTTATTTTATTAPSSSAALSAALRAGAAVAPSLRTPGTHLVVGGLGGFGFEMVSPPHPSYRSHHSNSNSNLM
jgi:hypothetical protein